MSKHIEQIIDDFEVICSPDDAFEEFAFGVWEAERLTRLRSITEDQERVACSLAERPGRRGPVILVFNEALRKGLNEGEGES